MFETMGNLVRAGLCIGITALIAYYDHAVNGWSNFITNFAFFALGFLLVSTWKNRKKEQSELILEMQSLKETSTPVVVVGSGAEIAKKEAATVTQDRMI